MKAIFTKYHGPTNFKGARISASDSDGNRVSLSYPYELSAEACHRKAAEALCTKMNWTGNMTAGGTKNGYVFTFDDEDDLVSWTACYRASNRIADTVYLKPDERKLAPTATWAEIIASEMGIERPEQPED